ncbi:MAG: DUF2924 domain-containing protein [Armatimonadetes bacterium]|nr:DUF2924 domain-containing protein [Armatimonadota bacterium]
MSESIIKQISNLKTMSMEELRAFYVTLHGIKPLVYNKDHLIKRLAHRLQEIEFGGISERVMNRLDDALAEHGYDENAMQTKRRRSRLTPLKNQPIIGSLFIRDWNGNRYQVTAIGGGFEYDGKRYRSLTAVAGAITGQHISGRKFFGLDKRRSYK